MEFFSSYFPHLKNVKICENNFPEMETTTLEHIIKTTKIPNFSDAIKNEENVVIFPTKHTHTHIVQQTHKSKILNLYLDGKLKTKMRKNNNNNNEKLMKIFIRR